jgi:hypothetical protein
MTSEINHIFLSSSTFISKDQISWHQNLPIRNSSSRTKYRRLLINYAYDVNGQSYSLILRLINNSLTTWLELADDTSKALVLLIKMFLGGIERFGVR